MQQFGNSNNETPFDFKQFYRDYYPMVRSHIIKNGGEEEDVRDLFQDLLTVLVIKSQKPEGIALYKNTKLSTYIFSIARNLWLQKLADKHNLTKGTNLDNVELSDASSQKELEQKMKEEQKFLIMERLFKQLGKDSQKILKAFYFKKQSLKKIAKDMKRSPEYIRLKKFRCMKKFRRLMDNDPNFQNLKSGY